MRAALAQAEVVLEQAAKAEGVVPLSFVLVAVVVIVAVLGLVVWKLFKAWAEDQRGTISTLRDALNAERVDKRQMRDKYEEQVSKLQVSLLEAYQGTLGSAVRALESQSEYINQRLAELED